MLLIDRSKSAAQCVRARVRTHPRLLCHGAGNMVYRTVHLQKFLLLLHSFSAIFLKTGLHTVRDIRMYVEE